MHNESIDSSDSENSFEKERQYQKIYAKQMKKRQAIEIKRAEKERDKASILPPSKQEITQENRLQEESLTVTLSKAIRASHVEVIYEQPA